MRDFVVFSRRGCHLCEEMIEELEPLCRHKARLIVNDVDSNAEWQTLYGLNVPVLVVDDVEVCRYHLDRDAVLGILNDAD